MAIIQKEQRLGRIYGRRDPYTLLMGMEISPPTMDNNLWIPQNLK
jgi:hypothetical protein